MRNFLPFEKEIEPIENAINALRHSAEDDSGEILKRIRQLEKDLEKKLRALYAKITPWEACQIARHPERPQALDFAARIFSDMVELRGDRAFADDPAIVAGVGKFENEPAVFLGQQKGRGTEDKLHRNFGMANPEGYRKALRVMNLAEKFSLPLLVFVDTPGAYPGIGAEERGQSGAIGECLRKMSGLRAPVVSVVIGEGGSGGALALAVADSVLMMQFAVYSVISPEGCASILWKDAARASDAAALLGIMADKLSSLNLIDEVVPEPVGGAHRDPTAAIDAVTKSVSRALARARRFDGLDNLVKARRRRLREHGRFLETGA